MQRYDKVDSLHRTTHGGAREELRSEAVVRRGHLGRGPNVSKLDIEAIFLQSHYVFYLSQLAKY